MTGIVGMLIIVSGKIGATAYEGDAVYGAGAAVASAIAYSLVLVLLRSRTGVDPLPTIVLLQNVGPALLLIVPALLVWTTPSLPDLARLVLLASSALPGTVSLPTLSSARKPHGWHRSTTRF
jgi:drug/metabolite transporter (DMT)-like permease